MLSKTLHYDITSEIRFEHNSNLVRSFTRKYTWLCYIASTLYVHTFSSCPPLGRQMDTQKKWREKRKLTIMSNKQSNVVTKQRTYLIRPLIPKKKHFVFLIHNDFNVSSVLFKAFCFLSKLADHEKSIYNSAIHFSVTFRRHYWKIHTNSSCSLPHIRPACSNFCSSWHTRYSIVCPLTRHAQRHAARGGPHRRAKYTRGLGDQKSSRKRCVQRGTRHIQTIYTLRYIINVYFEWWSARLLPGAAKVWSSNAARTHNPTDFRVSAFARARHLAWQGPCAHDAFAAAVISRKNSPPPFDALITERNRYN